MTKTQKFLARSCRAHLLHAAFARYHHANTSSDEPAVACSFALL